MMEGREDSEKQFRKQTFFRVRLHPNLNFVHSVHHELRNLVLFPDSVLRLPGHCLKCVVIYDKAL
jgi:hypothetical protein